MLMMQTVRLACPECHESIPVEVTSQAVDRVTVSITGDYQPVLDHLRFEHDPRIKPLVDHMIEKRSSMGLPAGYTVTEARRVAKHVIAFLDALVEPTEEQRPC